MSIHGHKTQLAIHFITFHIKQKNYKCTHTLDFCSMGQFSWDTSG